MFKKNKLDQLAVPLMLSQVLGLVIGLSSGYGAFISDLLCVSCDCFRIY